MFKKTALIAGIGLAISVTAQADYQWEVGGFYTFGEYKVAIKNDPINGNRSKDIDENIGGVFGTWYMEEVDTSKGPLREAAFLDHASNITLQYTDGKIDTDDDDEFGEPRSFATKVAMQKIAEDIINDIMTTW